MTNSIDKVPDQIPDMEQLKKMRFVAQMRAAADRNEMGFIGGYMDPETGEVFMQTNMDHDLVDTMLPTLLPDLEQLKNGEE